MKKWMAFLMAAVMMLGCFAGSFAEDAASSEETMLLQILGEKPVNLYANAEDAQASDTIEGGKICGLLGKETKDEAEWYQVVYLDKEGEGQVAWLPAEAAKRLTMEELAELMKDPDKANEILDLIEAINDLIEAKSKPVTQPENAANTAENDGNNLLKNLYEGAMGLLGEINTKNLEAGLASATGEAAKLGETALNAGKELAEDAAKKAGDLINTGKTEAGKLVEENLPKVEKAVADVTPEEVKDLLDSLKEKAGELKDASADGVPAVADKAKEILEELGDETGINAESVQKKLDELLDGAKKALDGKTLDDAKGIVDNAVSSLLDEDTKKGLEDIIDIATKLVNKSGDK